MQPIAHYFQKITAVVTALIAKDVALLMTRMLNLAVHQTPIHANAIKTTS